MVHIKYWHATTAVRIMPEKHVTVVWTSNALVFIGDCMPGIYEFQVCMKPFKQKLFCRRRNLFILIQYEWYFMLDVAHGLHSCYWLGGQAGIRTSHIILVDAISSACGGLRTRVNIYIRNMGSIDSLDDVLGVHNEAERREPRDRGRCLPIGLKSLFTMRPFFCL